ncbi:MAG: response regulator [Acidobacteriota bacterium]
MSRNDEEFLKRLMATFRVEAEDHIKAITAGLIDLEKSDLGDRRMDVIETVFREAHSFKGAARAVNLTDVETICQSIESIFAAVKRQDFALDPASFDLLHRAVDAMSRLVADQPAPPVAQLVADLDSLLVSSPLQPRSASDPTASAPVEERPRLVETVRISTSKLDSLLLQAEEMLSVRQSAQHRVADMREINQTLSDFKRELARVAPDARALNRSMAEVSQNHKRKDDPRIMKILSFLDHSSVSIKSLEGRLSSLIAAAESDNHLLEGMTENLLEDMKRASMLPFSSLLDLLPKLARDLSRDQGKQAQVVLRGDSIEVDRRILEEMKDPIIHLLRNSVDHGIETPPERERKGKPPQGTITVTVSPKEGGKVEIIISDDGCGVDTEKVKEAAIRLGLLSQQEAATSDEEEITSHIFKSGLSTSPLITDMSGRGLGLAIVQEKVERLGGKISFQSVRDEGMTFTITLPVMLATFRGVIVRASFAQFVFPTSSVERAVRISREDISTVENRETARLDGELVSVARLSDALGLASRSEDESRDSLQAVIVSYGDRRMAFIVDEVLREQEVLVKGLGRQLARVRNIAGATILGGGEVVPILNVADLVKSALSSASVARREAVETKEEKKSVLVVEDSITARALVAGILEASGYEVTTAFDGIDGLTKLRGGNFDLVVSDVDMPRMNGFDLTARIRNDARLANLPVVLVTALASREDQERGMEAGANAYIVKSDFDQSNLLEIIRRLI